MSRFARRSPFRCRSVPQSALRAWKQAAHRGVPPRAVAPLPVIVAEIRTQGVEIQGEPQSAAQQLCDHLSTAFPPARLPARGQQRQQNTEASIPTFRRFSSQLHFSLASPPSRLALPRVLPIRRSSPPPPPRPSPSSASSRCGSSRAAHVGRPRAAGGDRAPRPAAGAQRWSSAPLGPHPNPWQWGAR